MLETVLPINIFVQIYSGLMKHSFLKVFFFSIGLVRLVLICYLLCQNEQNVLLFSSFFDPCKLVNSALRFSCRSNSR